MARGGGCISISRRGMGRGRVGGCGEGFSEEKEKLAGGDEGEIRSSFLAALICDAMSSSTEFSSHQGGELRDKGENCVGSIRNCLNVPD